MVKGKRSSLSEEEKQILTNMKHQLSMMGVPREEWSSIIQEEITLHRQTRSKSSKQKSRITKFFEKIWQKIVKSFFKLTSKEYRENADEFDQMFEMMENTQREGNFSQKNNMMGMFNQLPDKERLESLGDEHGTFVTDRPDKKKIIVEFDDDID